MNKLFFVLLVLFCSACDNTVRSSDKNNSSPNSKNESVSNTELTVGGLYLIKSGKDSFSICKILVLDDDAVHLRTYQNNFQNEPEFISSDTLKVLIGHAPIARQGFLIDKPKLLKVEKVKESELEGYRYYLEAMNQ